MYFNTTHEKDVSEMEAKVVSQDEFLLNVLKVHSPRAFTAFDLLPYFKPNTPVTSVRRSITCLHKKGLIQRRGKRTGEFGRENYAYSMPVVSKLQEQICGGLNAQYGEKSLSL